MKKAKVNGLKFTKNKIANFKQLALNGGSSIPAGPTANTCVGDAGCGNYSAHCYGTRACDIQ